MRITFVLPRWSNLPSGGYKVVYYYANYLAEKGYNITIVYSGYVYYNQKRFPYDLLNLYRNFRYRFLPKPKLTWFPLSPKVNLLIVPYLFEQYIPDADIIFATSWKTAEWVNTYKRKKGNKIYLIQSYETWSGPEDKVNMTWKMPFKKIVVAKWLMDKALELEVKDVEYIPNGIEFEIFKIVTSISKRFPMQIGMLYHKSKNKGSQDGISALKEVKKKYSNLRVIFFSTYRKGKDIPNWMEFYHNPKIEDLVTIYNSCSIFVNPSHIEGWPLPPAEAMACGCALISTDISGVREYATHNETALLSPIGDPKALANNIIRLLGVDEYRVSIAERGNRYIQRFTWKESFERLENVIQTVMSVPR